MVVFPPPPPCPGVGALAEALQLEPAGCWRGAVQLW